MPPEDDKPPKGLSAADNFEGNEEPTLVTCFACGGEWETVRASEDRTTYKHILCAWCVKGSMTAKQIVKWRNHQRLRGLM